MVDKTELIVGVNTDEVKEGTKNLKDFGTTGEKTQSRTKKLDQATKKLTKQFERQARNAGKSANEIKILDLKARGATDAQLKAAQAAMKNAEAMKKQADAARFAAQSAGATGGPFRAMRGSMQQVSWQLQDVAVQAQMGTSAFTILGQQGPQIASIFGPGGAVVGALVAFGAMVGGVLFNSLMQASKAVKVLDDRLKSLPENFDNASAASKEYAKALVAQNIEVQQKLIEKLNAELIRGREATTRGTEGVKEYSESLEDWTFREKELGAKISEANVVIQEQKDSVDDLTDGTDSLLKKLGEELATLNLTEEQLFAYELAMSGATKEQIALGVATFNKLQKDKEAIEALKDAEAAVKKQTEATASYSEGLYHQLAVLTLSGDALFYYQAALKGGTAEQISANAELLKSIALRKEKIKADADFAKNELALAALFKKLNDKKIADEEKETASAVALAQKAAQRGLDKLTLLSQQHEAEKIALDTHLAAGRLSQELHDEAMKGQARETAAAIADIDKKANEDAKKLADARMQIQQQMLSGISGVIGQLADAAEEGSSEAKALFAIEKAIAIATTVMNAEVAAVAAMAAMPGPPGVLMGSVIRGIGYASAGIIAGTAIAGGRALGGQVRGGESYLVGERGPELLTMGTSGRIATNENLKNAVGGNSGSGVTVNQTINVTTGIQSTVRAEIVQLMPQIAQAAKGAVADGRQRGGNFSRAMSGA